ncbi:MAG: hypothetical protein ABJH26_00690, partial [Marinomonas sp.]
ETPSYRYKLTVEVDTPDGIKSGFSVIEVDTHIASENAIPTPGLLSFKVRGEAAAVDLPNGQTVFALLRSESEIQWAAKIVPHVVLEVGGKGDERIKAQLKAIRSMKGARAIPRTWPKVAWIEERSGYPMLVTFGDLDDPTSVAEVDPDDLSSSFGEGYALKRITVQVTDEAVTTGIEKRLGWLRTAEGAISKIPMSERPPVGTPLPLHATLPETSFRIGTKR